MADRDASGHGPDPSPSDDVAYPSTPDGVHSKAEPSLHVQFDKGSGHTSASFERELMDRRAAVLMGESPDFDWGVFLVYLLVHLFCPLSLLFWLPYKGLRVVLFQRLLPSTYGSLYLNLSGFLDSASLLTMNVLWICMACSPDARQRIGIAFLWPSFLITNVWAALRWSVIACKYGFMSDRERLSLEQHREFDEYVYKMNQLQILSSWQELDVALLVAEVERLIWNSRSWGG